MKVVLMVDCWVVKLGDSKVALMVEALAAQMVEKRAEMTVMTTVVH